MAEIFRIANILLVMGCFAGFAPAIVHARDNIDRLYLMGGAIILAGIALGSFIHLKQPFNPALPLPILGETLWAWSAIKSRRRRRDRLKSGGTSGE